MIFLKSGIKIESVYDGIGASGLHNYLIEIN